MFVQYLRYMQHLFQGDMDTSFTTSQPVLHDLEHPDRLADPCTVPHALVISLLRSGVKPPPAGTRSNHFR